jgi:hypothetical protein
MTRVWLILTNPYAYEQALKIATDRTGETGSILNAVFVIDPDAIGNLVRDLCETGWLGLESRRTLYDSMLEGYRALASDVIEDVQHQGSQENLVVEAAIQEGSLKNYLISLLSQGTSQIIVSASRSVEFPGKDIVKHLEWIEEN